MVETELTFEDLLYDQTELIGLREFVDRQAAAFRTGRARCLHPTWYRQIVPRLLQVVGPFSPATLPEAVQTCTAFRTCAGYLYRRLGPCRTCPTPRDHERDAAAIRQALAGGRLELPASRAAIGKAAKLSRPAYRDAALCRLVTLGELRGLTGGKYFVKAGVRE
jgi:hypothetical protein